MHEFQPSMLSLYSSVFTSIVMFSRFSITSVLVHKALLYFYGLSVVNWHDLGVQKTIMLVLSESKRNKM